MDLSVIAVGDVQNVLSAMQKNLECPICLDVVKEPVSTKCDHIFCRFCMFKLLSKKKKGVIQCPLCKTEVTKRSLKENSRFKQLIEGLLEAISAFELDTGVKFLSSNHLPKTSTEASASEHLGSKSSVIQSKGFRNRKRSAKENGQENFTLQEADVDTQLTDTRVKRCPLRNKTQKHDFEKGVLIELGTDSSEELFKQASNTGLEDKEELEEPKSAEKKNEYSCNTQPLKLGAKEIIPPNIVGETNSLKEALSKKSMPNITEHVKPDQVNMTECQSSPLNDLDTDLLTEQCDRIDNANPLKNEDASFSKNAEETDAEHTQCSSKSQVFDLGDSSEARLDKIKKIDIVVPSVEDVEMCEPLNDSLPEKEPPLEKLLQPKILHCTTLHQVSRKRLKRSIQKVNEWFSKSNEILSSSSSQDDPAETTGASGEEDISLSDKDSCISENTNPIVDSVEVAMVEGNKKWSKQTIYSIKDKLFGKTYERERKSNPPIIFREILPTTKNKDTAAEEESLNNSRKDGLKRKRKPAHVLQPEDFVKKKDQEEADECPQGVNSSLGDDGKKKCDESSSGKDNSIPKKRKGSTLAEFKEGGSKWKNATEKIMGKHSDGELELSNSDQKSTKNTSSSAKRCRRSTRTRCAIQLVVERNYSSLDPEEPLIDSYPSSEEPSKVDYERRQVRRSRRLQLLSEEIAQETGKRRIIKGARNYDSSHDESFCGVERIVLVHSSDSSSPKADSQEGEMLGSPFILRSPSKTVAHAASNLTEEKRIESCSTFSQDKGHCTQNVPEDFRIEKSPMAKNISELTKEAEDSELDTQYLRNIFRSSKRLSFSLFPTPMKACTTDDVASEKLKISCPDQVEKRHSKYFETENLQEEKTTAESLSSVGEKLKTCESACVSPVSCFSAECVHTGECQDDVSKVAKNGNLMTPIRMSAATSEGNNRPQKGEQGNEKTVSTDIEVESQLRQNPVRSNRSQSDQSNIEEHTFQRTDLNAVSETCFSSESNQAEKAEVVDCKEPMQHFQLSSTACPAACQQNLSEFSCNISGKKGSKRERRQVNGNEEQAVQTVSTGMPECLVREALVESFKGSSDFTDLSETPDGLLCSDNDIEENTSFCVTNRKDTSAVFVKRSDNAPLKELTNRVVSCKPRSKGIQRYRRRAQKLQSSDEESSEDEDLPCFQALIFGKSVSTPLQIKKQATPVMGSSVNPSTSPHSESHNENKQKTPEAALRNGCVSSSQESECSVNLFSSQSNMSEESVDGAQELKKPSLQVSNINESKEALQSCSGGLKKRKTNSKDECEEDPNMGANLVHLLQGGASGYNSETSHVEDSCGPFSQGEILSTQQKNVMQNNLKKLQQEMAALEAVLKQHGSQDSEFLPLCRELPHSSNSKVKELERSPELLIPSLKTCLSKRRDLEEDLQYGSVLKNEAASQETKSVQEAVQEYSQYQHEEENTSEQEPGTKLNKTSALPDLCGNVTRSPNSFSSSVKPPHPQTAEATNSSAVAQNNKSHAQVCKSKRSMCLPTSILPNAAGKENDRGAGVTNKPEMSIVASGLKQSEHLVVQKFARKTRSTFSNHITDGTTHVIMKTDKELVCERTLKYFLGIAGRKWVVSYQWIIQSFKEGRILEEENFEVKGDVINGRNHQGPKRARQSLTEKIFKDFEICCYGPFTDMTTGHLEWMVELCGASVVKQLHLFTHKVNSTAVVVVQPDAWMEGKSYKAIQQNNNVAVVTREWVLDSVACYECQELDAYLVS